MRLLKFLIPLAAMLYLAGCANIVSVDTVTIDEPIEKILVVNNPKVKNQEIETEMVKIFEKQGIASEIVPEEYKPQKDEHLLNYTAYWGWDMAVFLQKYNARLTKNGYTIGGAEYIARHMTKKFGRTAEKIEPLLKEMIKNHSPLDSVAASDK